MPQKAPSILYLFIATEINAIVHILSMMKLILTPNNRCFTEWFIVTPLDNELKIYNCERNRTTNR
jgi:hypothetical protein